MTENEIRARLETLMQERELLVGKINAYHGAIEDCQYWLDQITAANADTSDESVTSTELDGR